MTVVAAVSGDDVEAATTVDIGVRREATSMQTRRAVRTTCVLMFASEILSQLT
jgi:hypothetical protein